MSLHESKESGRIRKRETKRSKRKTINRHARQAKTDRIKSLEFGEKDNHTLAPRYLSLFWDYCPLRARCATCFCLSSYYERISCWTINRNWRSCTNIAWWTEKTSNDHQRPSDEHGRPVAVCSFAVPRGMCAHSDVQGFDTKRHKGHTWIYAPDTMHDARCKMHTGPHMHTL